MKQSGQKVTQCVPPVRLRSEGQASESPMGEVRTMSVRAASLHSRDGLCHFLVAALLFFAAMAPLASATDPDVVSPLVSYQFLDSLADPPAQPNIVSPVVSYQYLDWIGDENVTFQSSPSVSYYFSGGVVAVLTGSVRTVTGTPIGGATITLKRYGTVFWTGTSNAGGVFTVPQVQAANYMMTVAKAGFQTLSEPIAGYHGGNGTLDVTLAPAPAPLATQAVNRTPGAGAIAGVDAPDPGDAAAPTLMVFNGTIFVPYDPANPPAGVTVYPNRMTVVMSHGMRSSPNEWAMALAALIAANENHVGLAPNIVAWDWHRPASQLVPPPIDAACDQGEFLGAALHAALGPGYNQHVHFIGHSLGAIVNRIACDYVHGKLPESADRVSPNLASPWSLGATKPHITLLDEAEIASVFQQSVSTSTELGAKVAGLKGAVVAGAVAAIATWKGPIPVGVTWVDNYISMVGVQRDEAVNVALIKPAFEFMNPIAAHSYAHQWYGWSVTPSAVTPAIGYRLSREYTVNFPPSGTGKTAGSLWYQNPNAAADVLELGNQPNPQDFEANAIILSAYAVQAGPKVKSKLAELHEAGKARVVQWGDAALDGLLNVENKYVYQPLDATGRAVLQGYETGIELLGEAGGSVIYHTGNVISEISERVGNFWDATKDFERNLANSIDPNYAVVGPILAPGYRIIMKTEPTPPASFAARGSLAANQSNQPAYAWLTVNVPQNAGFLAFDFTLTGDPKNDRIVCAINEQNVFSLAGKFAPAGVPSSTDLIDVSAYAGQTIELFFGLAGGTSTDCEVAIDGIRFVTMPTPKVGIVGNGANVAVKWPAAASGWVLEATDSLSMPNWQPVPMTGVAVDQGVATVEQPINAAARFYRLRRAP